MLIPIWNMPFRNENSACLASERSWRRTERTNGPPSNGSQQKIISAPGTDLSAVAYARCATRRSARNRLRGRLPPQRVEPRTRCGYGRRQRRAKRLARCVARTQSWLSKLERGERSITVGDAYLFAAHFNVNPLCIVGPPTQDEQQRLDLDVADIRRAREKAGVIAQKVVERQSESRTNRRRASKLNNAEKRKPQR